MTRSIASLVARSSAPKRLSNSWRAIASAVSTRRRAFSTFFLKRRIDEVEELTPIGTAIYVECVAQLFGCLQVGDEDVVGVTHGSLSKMGDPVPHQDQELEIRHERLHRRHEAAGAADRVACGDRPHLRARPPREAGFAAGVEK